MSRPLRTLIVEDSEDDAILMLRELFQVHLQRRFDVVQAYRQAVHGLERLAQVTTALAE